MIVLLVVMFSSNRDKPSAMQVPASATGVQPVDHAGPQSATGSAQPSAGTETTVTETPPVPGAATTTTTATQTQTETTSASAGSSSSTGSAAPTTSEIGDGKTVVAPKHHATKRSVAAARDNKDAHHDKVDVDALLKSGLQAYVRGDTKTALDSFQRAKAASPGFAPAWRGLGMVYEKMGEAKSAKAAFQRYLQLVPSAADATSIRARMDALGS